MGVLIDGKWSDGTDLSSEGSGLSGRLHHPERLRLGRLHLHRRPRHELEGGYAADRRSQCRWSSFGDCTDELT